MKKFLSHMLLIIAMMLNVEYALADDKKTYISEILVYTYRLPFHLHEEPWVEVAEPGTEGNALDNDINSGSGGAFVYMYYKTTTDVKEAITDIVIVQDDKKRGEYDYKDNPLKINNKTYHLAKYYDYYDQAGNLNCNTNAPAIYVYYTKEGQFNGKNSLITGSRAITELELRYGNPDSSAEYAKLYNVSDGELTNNANCNENGKSVYLKLVSHKHETLTKVDKFDELNICACGYAGEDFIEPEFENGAYKINTLRELCWLRDKHNSREIDKDFNAVLKADIDMTPAQYMCNGLWEPISNANTDGWVWNGTFDGQGHKIRNFKASTVGVDDALPLGLFGVAGGTFCHLTMENVDLKGGTACVAALVGEGIGQVKIEDCKIYGSITGEGNSAAGFVNTIGGNCDVNILRCENAATVTASKGYDACGFVGAVNNNSNNQTVNIDCCINSGKADYAFARKPVGSITNSINVATDVPMMDIYLGSDVLQMNSLANAGGIKMDRAGLYTTPQPYCYTFNPAYISQAGEGILNETHVAQGELCFLLNHEVSSMENTWRQRIGEDAYPTPIQKDDDLLRVVHMFTKDDADCRARNFTNSWFYAEDNQGGSHFFTYTPGEVTDEGLKIDMTCTICGLITSKIAKKVGVDRVVWTRTCERDGLSLSTYRLEEADKTFYVEHRISSAGLNPNTHFLQGHINYAPIDGVPNNMEICQFCGEKRWRWVHTKTSAEHGWQIMDVEDMIAYLEECRTKTEAGQEGPNATLMNDIDMTEAADWYLPWLQNVKCRPYLKNIRFNGNGHKISGLYFTGEAYGLFSDIYNCRIENLTIEGEANTNHGLMLCHWAENCTFENVKVNGNINAYEGCGPVCFKATNCHFIDCHNYATVSATRYQQHAGLAGIVGSATDGSMQRCTNNATVDGRTTEYVGGLVGSYTGEFTITDCANYGDIYGRRFIGGIVGSFSVIKNPTLDYNSLQACMSKSLNVGKITLTGENFDKGGFSGYCNIPCRDNKEVELFVRKSYYRNAQVAIGFALSPLNMLTTGHVVTDQQLASGEVCYKLNTDEKVWHQIIEGADRQLYPYPYGTANVGLLNANNSSRYIAENTVMEQFEIHPDGDGKDSYFHTEVPFTVTDMKYSRDAVVTKQKYATLYLPFAFTNQRLKVMEFDHYDDATGKVYFAEVEGLTEPNHPYLVRQADDCAEQEVPLVITAEDARIVPTTEGYADFENLSGLETGFYGTYVQSTILGSLNYYAFSSKYGDFRKANAKGTYIYPFRATFKVGPGSEAPAKLMLSNFEDGVTQIEVNASDIVEMDNTTSVYNLNGQRVANFLHGLKSGIYIFNGKKVNVK